MHVCGTSGIVPGGDIANSLRDEAGSAGGSSRGRGTCVSARFLSVAAVTAQIEKAATTSTMWRRIAV
jgi:hypothetical protein